MAQTWEDPAIKNQGKLYNDAEARGDAAGMQAARTEANRLRTNLGYQTNSSGLNQTALPGWQADSTNTKFTQIPQSTQQQSYAQDNSWLINQQYESALSALKAQIQQSINNKNNQISALPQKYQPIKNESEVQRYSNLRSVLEQNANAGDRGGVGRQASLQTQTAADNRLNDITLQQTNEETGLRNEIANLLLEGNIQEAQISAQRLKDLISNNQYLDQTNYSRLQDSIQNSMQRAGLTGYLDNGQRTMQGQQLDNQTKQQNLDNLYREKTFNYQKSRDAVADSQWQQTMGLNLRQQTFQEAQAKIENALAQKRINQDAAGQALQWARFNADQDPNSLDNQLKRDQLDMNKQSKAASALNDTVSRIDSLYTYKDPDSGMVSVNETSKPALRNYILSLRLTDDQTDQLLTRYGLPINP